MKRRGPGGVYRELGALAAVLAVTWVGVSVTAQEIEWPYEIEAPEAKIVIYQPQLESFKGNAIMSLAAVSVTPTGQAESVFGAVWFKAHVSTDRDERLVTLLDVEVTHAKFPNAEKEDLDKLAQIIRAEVSGWEVTFSLDELLTALELTEKEQETAAELETTPPKILFTAHPAMLVILDGEPELRPVEGSDLMRVVNTPFVIVLDMATKTYYLKSGDAWAEASEVMGPWRTADSVPAKVTALIEEGEDEVDAGEEVTAQAGRFPQIIVAKEPTELIVSDGDPKYTPIQNTGLLYMSNTDSDVFREISTQKLFVLLSGRWYVARSLEGPWSYVPSDGLPADFAQIPSDTEKGDVLAFVAGTDEATEAVYETHIPQTATIDRSAAALNVEYDGAPEFKAIEGTEMSYAVNTPYDVLRIDNRYYCCHEAVWFVADDPMGPWGVCVTVPQVIYTMPPSSPVYHVRYVYVYDYTPSVVYVGYTPGYIGCYVYHGTVVYGTGHYYRGYCGTRYYYSRPKTWGFSFHYNRYTGSWGVRSGYVGSRGWVGFGYHNGKYVSGGWVRGGYYGGRWWGCGGFRHANVKIDRSININRVNIGNRNIYARGNNINRNVRRPGRVARTQPARGSVRRASPGSRATPRTTPGRANNVYADRNGNVHRRTQNGWEQRTRNGWQSQRPSARQTPSRGQPGSAQRPADRSARPTQPRTRLSGQASSLDRQHHARQRGTQRSSQYRQHRGGASRSSAGSAPRRSGGGGRRR